MSSEAKSATETDRLIGSRIAAIRKAKGISQTDLGKAVGVTFQQVQKYEKGVNRIGSGRLQEIARFLEIKVASLFEDGEAEPSAPANEVFQFLAIPGATDLLQLYSGIEDRNVQQHVLNMVRSAAAVSAKSRIAPEQDEDASESAPVPVAAQRKVRGKSALARRAAA